ncbi:hypothetical protein K503DRAFT_33688 [Rhizopogon vinicolor AM-OR11-026]|uniref:Uncharacterized protein n=1 Tax=Rhizopogon vinicolor AM-OR11-026 TaxID=1314800 RepID=A0A1B7MH50_9AGAM|nr:hypothetical protein K503DRAFT_33688 [Rhizopogon vinicolor AM-OR11-026]
MFALNAIIDSFSGGALRHPAPIVTCARKGRGASVNHNFSHRRFVFGVIFGRRPAPIGLRRITVFQRKSQFCHGRITVCVERITIFYAVRMPQPPGISEPRKCPRERKYDRESPSDTCMQETVAGRVEIIEKLQRENV